MAVHLQTTEVVAVVAAVDAGVPLVLTVGAADGVPALPAGPLLADHRSLQSGLRSWVRDQTGLRLGFVEQLYTFADRERAGAHQRVISVSYVGLARPAAPSSPNAHWRGWYELFPWEDRRSRAADGLVDSLRDGLTAWAEAAGSAPVRGERLARLRLTFGSDDRAWRPEDCLARYELLWEAGLLAESQGPSGGLGSAGEHAAAGRGRTDPAAVRTATTIGREPGPEPDPGHALATGPAMRHDHRRIVATGMARLRGKLQYRPVVFELLPEEFTLGQLQQVVEALSGTGLHKQNFRRLVETEELVEETGGRTSATGGRPARLFRFRPDVLSERPSAGLRLPQPRPPRAG